MTTIEPFLPHPDDRDDSRDQIAAADAGVGAPEPAPGLGVEGEEPDRVDVEPPVEVDPSRVDTPFRTPEVS